MSDEFDIYNPGVVRLRMKKLTQNLQLSRQKTVRILTFCDQKAKETRTKDVGFFVEIEKESVTINCKKLARLSDNHTQKLINDTLKSLQSEKEVTSSQEVRRRSKKKIRDKSIVQNGAFYTTRKNRKMNGKRLVSFDLFWEAFNYKKGRAEAADSWLDIPTLTDSLVAEIIRAAKSEALNRKNLIEQGKTPKMAQGWLTGKRWEDEINAGPRVRLEDVG